MMARTMRMLALAGAMALAAGAAMAQPATAPVALGDLTITAPWVRPTPPAAPTAAGYLSIANHGASADRLVGASTPDAASVEMHEMSISGGVMRMRPVAGGIAIPAGGTVTLAPGGYHLMIISPKHQFEPGGTVAITLQFAKAGTVTVAFPVAQGPAAAGGAMPGMKGAGMGTMPGMGGAGMGGAGMAPMKKP